MSHKLYKQIGLTTLAIACLILGFTAQRPAINATPQCIVSDPGMDSNISCTVTQANPTTLTVNGVPGNIYGWEHDRITCQRPEESFICNLTANHGELRINYGVNDQESEAILQVFN